MWSLPMRLKVGYFSRKKNLHFFFSVLKTILEVVLLLVKMHGSWINVLVIEMGWRIYQLVATIKKLG